MDNNDLLNQQIASESSFFNKNKYAVLLAGASLIGGIFYYKSVKNSQQEIQWELNSSISDSQIKQEWLSSQLAKKNQQFQQCLNKSNGQKQNSLQNQNNNINDNSPSSMKKSQMKTQTLNTEPNEFDFFNDSYTCTTEATHTQSLLNCISDESKTKISNFQFQGCQNQDSYFVYICLDCALFDIPCANQDLVLFAFPSLCESCFLSQHSEHNYVRISRLNDKGLVQQICCCGISEGFFDRCEDHVHVNQNQISCPNILAQLEYQDQVSLQNTVQAEILDIFQHFKPMTDNFLKSKLISKKVFSVEINNLLQTIFQKIFDMADNRQVFIYVIGQYLIQNGYITNLIEIIEYMNQENGNKFSFLLFQIYSLGETFQKDLDKILFEDLESILNSQSSLTQLYILVQVYQKPSTSQQIRRLRKITKFLINSLQQTEIYQFRSKKQYFMKLFTLFYTQFMKTEVNSDNDIISNKIIQNILTISYELQIKVPTYQGDISRYIATTDIGFSLGALKEIELQWRIILRQIFRKQQFYEQNCIQQFSQLYASKIQELELKNNKLYISNSLTYTLLPYILRQLKYQDQQINRQSIKQILQDNFGKDYYKILNSIHSQIQKAFFFTEFGSKILYYYRFPKNSKYFKEKSIHLLLKKCTEIYVKPGIGDYDYFVFCIQIFGLVDQQIFDFNHSPQGNNNVQNGVLNYIKENNNGNNNNNNNNSSSSNNSNNNPVNYYPIQLLLDESVIINVMNDSTFQGYNKLIKKIIINVFQLKDRQITLDNLKYTFEKYIHVNKYFYEILDKIVSYDEDSEIYTLKQKYYDRYYPFVLQKFLKQKEKLIYSIDQQGQIDQKDLIDNLFGSIQYYKPPYFLFDIQQEIIMSNLSLLAYLKSMLKQKNKLILCYIVLRHCLYLIQQKQLINLQQQNNQQILKSSSMSFTNCGKSIFIPENGQQFYSKYKQQVQDDENINQNSYNQNSFVNYKKSSDILNKSENDELNISLGPISNQVLDQKINNEQIAQEIIFDASILQQLEQLACDNELSVALPADSLQQMIKMEIQQQKLHNSQQ